jgi:cytochrome b
MLTGRPRHYVGHNPAGGAMVVALLTALLLTTLAGMSLIAIDGSGPLAGTFVSQLDEHLVKDIHELFANFTVALIALHVTGVMLSSLLHRENLVRSMVTGKKQASDN